MSQIQKPNVWRVDIFESERGWGQRLDEEKYFDNELEARNFVNDFNSKNDLDYVPDWYMVAFGPYKLR